MLNDNSNSFQNYYSLLFRSICDDIRSSASDRQLRISGDDVLFFSYVLSEECTDETIQKFVIEMKKNHTQNWDFVGSKQDANNHPNL